MVQYVLIKTTVYNICSIIIGGCAIIYSTQHTIIFTDLCSAYNHISVVYGPK